MKIDLFQIYFKPEHKTHLAKVCTPYDNSAGDSTLCEYGVFMKEFDNIQASTADYTGFISWKFRQKTRKTPQDFFSFIKLNPGHDIYAFQPFPLHYFPQGSWVQGDRFHPNLLKIMHLTIKELNLDPNILHFTLDPSKLITCNYWVATKQFWQAYQNYTLPIAEFLIDQKHLNTDIAHLLSTPTVGDISHVGNLFPYIMERLVVSFLLSRPDFKTKIWHTADNIAL